MCLAQLGDALRGVGAVGDAAAAVVVGAGITTTGYDYSRDYSRVGAGINATELVVSQTAMQKMVSISADRKANT